MTSKYLFAFAYVDTRWSQKVKAALSSTLVDLLTVWPQTPSPRSSPSGQEGCWPMGKPQGLLGWSSVSLQTVC